MRTLQSYYLRSIQLIISIVPVLFHHIQNPEKVLNEFKRILKLGGSIRVMVYNYNSLWVHLH
ncbi:methyltransferase domain-containing protein [Candidatus Coxiella mudrowiae]|uniref:methyltransferase domain-containing protein n=1 Tax=Candidatus Coxiella mudrowiae TaxID=2054173 RepID=UPI003CC8384F